MAQPLKTVSRHCFRTLGLVTLVALIFTAAAYIRLLQGPMSFSFIVPKVQAELNNQLNGYRFGVGDAILRVADDWGLEFRLANVSLTDTEGHELAKAPYAAVDLSEAALLRFSFAPSSISLLGPKVLVFSTPEHGLALTVPQQPLDGQPLDAAAPQGQQQSSWRAETAPGSMELPAQAQTQPQVTGQPFPGAFTRPLAPSPAASTPFNPGPLMAKLFAALQTRGGASTSLTRVGFKNATIYFASSSDVSAWSIADFHLDLQEGRDSHLHGEVTLQQDSTPWHVSFDAINQPQQKRYLLTASVNDVIPQTIWRSVPAISALKLFDLPVSGVVKVAISHSGLIASADAEMTLKGGQFWAPWDDKHPAAIDSGVLKASYDGEKNTVTLQPFELRWEKSVLSLSGTLFKRGDSQWVLDVDGRDTKLGAEQFGIEPVGFEALHFGAIYDTVSDRMRLSNVLIQSGSSRIAIAGEMSGLTTGGGLSISGTLSPMPMSFFKVIWPTFVAHGARDWIGSNIPQGGISAGTFAVNLPKETLENLSQGADVPDSAVSLNLGLSGLQIYHIKGLPPIQTKETRARVVGRHFTFDIPSDAQIELPSGRKLAFSDGKFFVDDLRPRFPDGEISFKAQGDTLSTFELLDQPPLGYVKAVGFKPNLLTGQVSTAFTITMPLLKDLKFKQLGLAGKARVTEIKSNGLPAGIVVNNGAINFDVTHTAIAASGELRVNNTPVSLIWQRIFDAPPEQQPTLRMAGILTERAREELGLNINHIVRGDMPIAVAFAMQRDAPPKVRVETNMTNADIFLTAIGWRKPAGQKASLTFEVDQRSDNSILLDNFVMMGTDGLNINGWLLFNEKKRIAGFSFPEFSTNDRTKMAVGGELSPQNILKIQAKGQSYDGRQFFRSLFSAGRLAENQPAPPKDEPGLDLTVEIDSVLGSYDTSVKSVLVNAKRRSGKISYLEVNGRLDGDSPLLVHLDQKPGEPRILSAEISNAGSVFRLLGFYPSVQGGLMSVKVNMDGGGAAEKYGMLGVQNFTVVGDQIIGEVVSKAEQEGGQVQKQVKSAQAAGRRAPSSSEPLQFDKMTARFYVSNGQFNLQEAAIRGPVIGLSLRGSVDYTRDAVNLSGTYVPLQGLNSMFSPIPLIGDILGKDNGLIAITFAIQGRTSNPEVLVNPVSLITPGVFRAFMEFNTDQNQAPPPPPPPQKTPSRTKNSRANSTDTPVGSE